jgi:hypothetical protein
MEHKISITSLDNITENYSMVRKDWFNYLRFLNSHQKKLNLFLKNETK